MIQLQLSEHKLLHCDESQGAITKLRTLHKAASAELNALRAYRTALNDGLDVPSKRDASREFLQVMLNQAVAAARTDLGNIELFNPAEGVVEDRSAIWF